MIKRVALLLVILVLGLPASALAGEAVGTIEGRLVNGTAGSTSSVANVEVTLKTSADNVEVRTDNTATDAEGRVVFKELATSANYSYQMFFTYQGVEYSSGVLSFTEGELTQSVEVNVYDTAATDEAIGVMMAHTVIYVEQEGLRINEYYLVANNSDRVYIGSKDIPDVGKKETLVFALPDGATNLQVGNGLTAGSVYEKENGFVDTSPVLPGGKEVSYSYNVGYGSGEYIYCRKPSYPTTNYNLLVESGTVQVTSDQLIQEEPLEIGGTRFNHLSGSNLSAGNVVTARLTGLPGTASKTDLAWVFWVLAMVVFGFVAVYVLKKRRPQPVSLESEPERRQQMLKELAQLDDDFESGQIEEDAYRQMRAEKKSQLIALARRPKESGDDKQ